MQGRRVDSSRGLQHARLPAIAPRTKGSSPNSQTSSTAQSNLQSESRRSRLPPRSRSGCWTCRTRKVKCGEERPSCAQCLRLGHNCDYNPRLSFRDDTSRIVERMQEVSTVGNSVWNPDTSESSPSRNRSVEDLLPPFAALTTDEDRERKAELKDPGTYHVIANPRSFVSLPEYRDENAGSGSGSGSAYTNFDPDDEIASHDGSLDGSEDPNVVILKTFDETPRRIPIISSNNPTSSTFPEISQVSGFHPPVSMAQTDIRPLGDSSMSMLDVARSGGRDSRLLQHYRTAISPHIIQTARSDRDEDLFETQARTYPPLFHAMMALAALSIAKANSADALEHYQSVIPALKTTVQSSQDSYSDGALFTHFILLLYESGLRNVLDYDQFRTLSNSLKIAAVGHRESMWGHHIDQLLKIITLRRHAYGAETYDFIVWTICAIDIYALLSVSGTGTFVELLLKQNMMPMPERCLTPLPHGQSLVIYPEEQSFFPAVLKLNQEVILLALRVGQEAAKLRAEAAQRRYGSEHQSVSGEMFIMNRRARIQELHRLMEHSRDAWRSQYPTYWTWLSQSRLPRVFAWITHSYMLFRACMIYLHTSMYPSQLLDPAPESEIRTCATEIIQVARIITSQERFEQQFIVFPLYMAGLATKDPAEKDAALATLRVVERHSYGKTTESVRELLGHIYEKQRAAIVASGDASSVDWVEEMESSGQRLIMYGL